MRAGPRAADCGIPLDPRTVVSNTTVIQGKEVRLSPLQWRLWRQG